MKVDTLISLNRIVKIIKISTTRSSKHHKPNPNLTTTSPIPVSSDSYQNHS